MFFTYKKLLACFAIIKYIFHSMTTLELAEALTQKDEYDPDRTVSLLAALQVAVEANNPATSLRDLVLRSLYHLVDSDDERILVAIASIMLTVRHYNLFSYCFYIFM